MIDTRPDSTVGPRSTPLGSGETHHVSAADGNCNGKIPIDASGISLNVTTVGASQPTFITIWATGDPQPFASSLNPTPGQPPTPNAVITALSADGRFDIFNLAGSVHVLADINGYFVDHNHDDRYFSKTEIDAMVWGTADIADGAITTAKLADNSVTSAKVVNETLADVDLASNSVGSSELQTDSVQASEIVDNSIDSGEIVDFGLSNQDIAVLTAEVNADATLASGCPGCGVTSSRVGAVGAGTYEVDFARNVTSCVHVATLGNASTSVAAGEVSVVDRFGNTQAVFVDTNNSDGTAADKPFKVVVVC